MYGEDGLDVVATPWLRKFGFLARNAPRLMQRLDLPAAAAASRAAGLGTIENAVKVKDISMTL